MVLRQREDRILLQVPDPDLRLSEVAEPLREALRENMERIAADNAIEIELVRSRKSFRKEDRVKEVLEKRGEHPGVVCILSAREPCGSYKPWHDSRATRPI
jgi:hypothetical protein